MMPWIARRIVYPLQELACRRPTFGYLDALERSQWLSREELEALQCRKLNRLLAIALAHCPWHARRLRGTGHARRAGECGDGAVERFVTALSHDQAATVAVIAMSRFDTVNAAFGREAGDALLRETGARIAAALPSAAVIERDEGARFLVAMKEDEADAAVRIATIEAALTPFTSSRSGIALASSWA